MINLIRSQFVFYALGKEPDRFSIAVKIKELESNLYYILFFK